ncbi:MAG: HAD-IC family P-type ATPase [archaeon]
MLMENAHTRTKEGIFRDLHTSEKGLDSKEAKKRLTKYGLNKISKKKKKSSLLLFLKQFNSPLIYILLVAMIISFIFHHQVDGYVILVIVMINASIGFFEERKAEHAIDALEKLIVSYAKVLRDKDEIKIPSSQLVPGDIIFLEEGDSVPADARLIEIDNLRTQEASLTGESLPTEKSIRVLDKHVSLADQTNMVFMSTTIVSGTATAVVVATSNKTAIGQVAKSIQEIIQPKMHFTEKVNQLAFQMSIFAVIGAILVFLVGYFINGLGFFEVFLFTIASLVSAIPEGLPAVLIVVLAIGARRMAKRNAVIRHLPAVETLGVATVIATDKTGTITQNSITIEKIMTSEGVVNITGIGWEPLGKFYSKDKPINPLTNPQIEKLLNIAALCNKGHLLRKDGEYEIIGDPTEVALLVLGKKAGLDKEKLSEKLVDDMPFSSDLQYRASLIKDSENKKYIYTVGAFETILHKCSYFMDGDKKVKLVDKETKRFLVEAEELAKKGLRVLALAYRDVPSSTENASKNLMMNLIFVGFVGMKDPPRPGIKKAIEKARNAGIRVIMKTGDHKETAIAIAKEIGLVTGKSKALTQEELKKMDDKEFRKAVKEVDIFARVTPKMKLRIVRELQEQGEIVAMTGDGVNDAPALKSADIGISMGIIGTDVARESSEIVLTDDNFASIVNAVEEGRIVFRNVRRTSFYLVTTNVAEQVTIISAMSLGFPLPMLPIQILYLNLVTDTFNGIALSMEPGHKDVLNQPPRDKKEKILNKDIIPFLILIAGLMVIGTIPLFKHYIADIDKARTVAFTTMSMFQLFNVFNMRSIKFSLFKVGVFSNKWVTYSLIVSFALMLGVIYLPWISDVFQFVPLTIGELGLITLIASSVFVVGEIYKRFRHGNGEDVY